MGEPGEYRWIVGCDRTESVGASVSDGRRRERERVCWQAREGEGE